MSGTVLQVERLAYRYGKTEVFADVSFVLQEGEIALLTGPNGAGKSTMLRCLAGWDAPREGGVELVGKRFEGSDRAARRLVTFVPDVPSVLRRPHRGRVTCASCGRRLRLPASDDPSERLMEPLRPRRAARSACLRPTRAACGTKLALVLAFARAPRLLLLDEPYGPLDPDAAAC